MSRSGKAAKGFATSLFQYSSQILLQALLAPVVLRMSGRETLGAFAAIMQVVALLQLVDIAGAWSLERFMAQAIGRDPSGARFREVFTTARLIFLLSYITFALLVVLLSFVVGRMFHLTPQVDWQARWALRVIALWAVVRTPLAAYMNGLVAMQEMATANLIGTLTGSLRVIASLGLVLAGGGLFGLMVAGALAEACGLTLSRVRFKKLFPHLMPKWGIPDRALLREMIGFGGHAMIYNLGYTLVARSGNMVAGLTSGAAMASVFYTSQTPGMMGTDLVQRFADSTTPGINELYGRGERERMRYTITRLVRLMLVLCLPLAIGILLFNHDLVVVWVGSPQYAGRLLTMSLGVCCIGIAMQRVAVNHTIILGWMRMLSATTLAQGACFFGLALWLGHRLGLGGITLSLALVIIPQNVILWRRLNREFRLNAVGLLRGCLSRSIVPLGIAAALSWLIHDHIVIRHHHLQGFLAETFVFVAVYGVLAYFLSLQADDRAQVNHHFGNLVAQSRLVGMRVRRVFGAV